VGLNPTVRSATPAAPAVKALHELPLGGTVRYRRRRPASCRGETGRLPRRPGPQKRQAAVLQDNGCSDSSSRRSRYGSRARTRGTPTSQAGPSYLPCQATIDALRSGSAAGPPPAHRPLRHRCPGPGAGRGSSRAHGRVQNLAVPVCAELCHWPTPAAGAGLGLERPDSGKDSKPS
jgi:hypothetical protein